MKPLALINVVGLTPSLLGAHTPNINRFLESGKLTTLLEPYPAVTCTSQACMLTGKVPSEHGIVGNGWYFRDLAEVGFWKQSNALIQAPKVWDEIRKLKPGFKVSKLFWWYNMYSTADVSMTPRPHYPADGRKVFDIYTEPADLGKRVQAKIGKFPFFTFWGPNAGLACSEWIAKAAMETFDEAKADLTLIYLPHLDYPLQRLGPNHASIHSEVVKVDVLLGQLINFYEKHNVSVMLVSEYGISEVNTAIHPNRILREAGYLKVRKSVDWEVIDFGACPALAVSDHQISHIYLRDVAIANEVANLFRSNKDIQQVIMPNEREQYGLNHERAGDIILIAKSNAWFTYYYWENDALAPDYARCVDIHRKPGYDPVELFVDPKIPFPKLKVAYTLAKKMLGLRYYMDVIPLDPSLVKGSHGTPAQNRVDRPVCITSHDVWNSMISDKQTEVPIEIPMTDVYQLIYRYFSSQS